MGSQKPRHRKTGQPQFSISIPPGGTLPPPPSYPGSNGEEVEGYWIEITTYCDLPNRVFFPQPGRVAREILVRSPWYGGNK